MVEEFIREEVKAPFNMALSTLEALRKILSDIKQISVDPYLTIETKQTLKIYLLKRFYVDSSPLLEDNIVEKYKNILNIKPKEIPIISKENSQLTGKNKVIFDFELEVTLDKHLINLQQELQKEKYYMPPKKRAGLAVGEFL